MLLEILRNQNVMKRTLKNIQNTLLLQDVKRSLLNHSDDRITRLYDNFKKKATVQEMHAFEEELKDEKFFNDLVISFDLGKFAKWFL